MKPGAIGVSIGPPTAWPGQHTDPQEYPHPGKPVFHTRAKPESANFSTLDAVWESQYTQENRHHYRRQRHENRRGACGEPASTQPGRIARPCIARATAEEPLPLAGAPRPALASFPFPASRASETSLLRPYSMLAICLQITSRISAENRSDAQNKRGRSSRCAPLNAGQDCREDAIRRATPPAAPLPRRALPRPHRPRPLALPASASGRAASLHRRANRTP